MMTLSFLSKYRQPLDRLYQGLDQLASPQRYLFTPSDMRVLVADISDDAYRALLSRAAKGGKLERVCRGLYVYHPAKPVQGLMLFHAAARLRAHEFNYISLETALSDSGLLQKLCFIGGTCLRACYGSSRLSEDLDFTGGAHFNRESAVQFSRCAGVFRLGV